MTELSLNILDIAYNSVAAKASLIEIIIAVDSKADTLTISIKDNGCGMDAEMVKKVSDPFTTTRTTRKVGMGIPLFAESARSTGGTFTIESEKGVGTVVTAVFGLSSIDRMPLGDVADSVAVLLGGVKNTDFVLSYTVNGQNYTFDTRQIKEFLGEDDLSDFETVAYLKEMIKENTLEINGGLTI